MSGAKIPTTIVTGFLGAGKTTLIRHLMSRPQGKRIALIVNEFGDVGVDGEILRACGIEDCADDDIIELANGCICCTVAEDFVPTMTRLLARENPPEHIVIETSGLALPQPLVRAFRWPEIRAAVTVDGVIAVIDGAAVAEGRFADDEAAVAAERAADPNVEHDNPLAELFEDQLISADLIVVNKMDLVDEAGSEAIDAALREHARPGVGVVRTAQGRLPAALLIGLHAESEADIDNRPSHHEREGEETHDHDDFASFVADPGQVADARALKERLAAAIAAHGILRCKGFVSVENSDMRLLVQAVGPRIESYFDRPWRPGEARASRLVVIGGQGFDQAAIAAAIAGMEAPCTS